MNFQYGEKYRRTTDGKIFRVVDHTYNGTETVTRGEEGMEVIVLEQNSFVAVLQSQSDVERVMLSDYDAAAQDFELWELAIE